MEGFFKIQLPFAVIEKFLVKNRDNIIKIVDIQDIRNEACRRIESEIPAKFTMEGVEFTKKELLEIFTKGITTYINDGKLHVLKNIDIDINNDTKNETYFFFKNGYVEVTKDGATLKTYSQLKGAVWEDNIIDKDIRITPDVVNDAKFMQFLRNTCTDPKTNKLEEDRLKSLLSSIGYAVSRYNNPSYSIILVIQDGNLNDENIADGGAGKSLIAKAVGKLSNIRKQAIIDGRRLKPNHQFALQSIQPNDQCIIFDDIQPNFDLSFLFSAVTDGLECEGKGLPSFRFEQEYNPKMIITTNYIIKGEGSSYDRRKFELELLPYYNARRKPEDDFGNMFYDWDENEWNNFYNLIFMASQTFHQNNARIHSYHSYTLEEKKRKLEVDQDFAEFMDDVVSNRKELWTPNETLGLDAIWVPEVNRWVFGQANLRQSFIAWFKHRDHSKITNTWFGNQVKKYCEQNEIKLEKRKATKKDAKPFYVTPGHKVYEFTFEEPKFVKNDARDIENNKIEPVDDNQDQLEQVESDPDLFQNF
ncbi:MAG: hypothetical protein HQK65_19630 [Desulfamplus sp.]|nr:hypothetical protein [Desulfamplus sp.]